MTALVIGDLEYPFQDERREPHIDAEKSTISVRVLPSLIDRSSQTCHYLLPHLRRLSKKRQDP
jgi:hypothetical protein